MRTRLLAFKKGISALLRPEGAFDAAGRRTFEREAQETNARIFRWHMLVIAPAHILAAALFIGRHEVDPAKIAWVTWLLRLDALLAALGLAAAAVAWSGRPAWARRALGDIVGTLYLLGTAATSANAARAHPTLNTFVIGTLFTAFFLRMRPRVYVPALLAAAGLLFAALLRFLHDPTALRADIVALALVMSTALFGFFINRGVRVRELSARRTVEHLNSDLERMVTAQVREIVQRAREIELLNTQLNERIRERSHELSVALARLAEGPEPLAQGTVLAGRVEIEGLIGQGGMGIVYRARDRVTGRAVAVKVVQASSASELDGLYRFLREAQAMAIITHPAIVRPLHVDVSEDGRLFQIMELVDGTTLETCLSRAGSLPSPTVARLGAVLADALAAVHAAGVVHRDVKPGNVMLTRTAPGLKLLDFGISDVRGAHFRESDARVLGTRDFVSPELLDAPRSVAAPADVYALGVLLYLAVSGHMPFDAESSRTIIFTRLLGTPVDIVRWVPDIDPALARAVMACLHKDPARRPSARSLADVLAATADEAGAPSLPALQLAASPEREATPAPAPPCVPTLDVTRSPAPDAMR